MPSWWARSSSKDAKKKTSKETVVSVPEQKGIIRSIWSRRRWNDAVSERGSRSRAISRSPSPSPNGLRCQSFADRPTAQPLPLPVLQASSVARSASEISGSRPMLEKRGRPPLTLPLPKPSQTLSKPDVIDVDGNLGTASISSNCSVDSDDAADSRLPSPQGTDLDLTGKTISEKTSRVPHGDYTSQMNQVNSRELPKPFNPTHSNPMLSISPRNLTPNFSQTIILSSRHGNLGSAPDSSMSSPSRSPMRAVTLDPISSSFLWTQRPFADVNFLGSGQCSSPGSGQTSGHNSISMGGDMGQPFWQINRGSAECSPIPSPRMTSAGPSSRIQSGAVTPIHPRAGGTAPESPTGRIDDGRITGHRLRLPPVNITNTSPFATSASTSNNPPSPIPRSPGRTDSVILTGSRWKKGKMIGRGTFGHVYVGFNSETGEMCAMKEVTLFSDDAKSKESAKHLGQEISLLSRLRHRNIVRYYGSEMIDDKFYIYLEYVSGGSIHKLLQEYGQFGEPVIQHYTYQILSGLAYLHATNTVHRDIKGANILVDPNGRVKLADFGMAKHITGQSTPLSFKGSPYWMAPEVIRNTNGCHLPVDIWSLGCTVLEMATSKPPWSQYEGIAAMFKIGNSKELPPIPDHLSNDAKDFIRLCLQREPSDRPAAAELLRHPFMKNVALAERSVQLERNILRPDNLEAAGGLTGSHLKDLVHERNATSMDVERLNVLPQVGTKPFKSSSSCHVSCPVSPCGSPLPRSRSPQHINGRMSPSPIASPRMDSGASTPITGGTGAIPYRQPKPYLHEDFEHKPHSPNYLSTSDLFRGTLSGLASEGGMVNSPFRSPSYAEAQPYLAACVRQQLLRDKKT